MKKNYKYHIRFFAIGLMSLLLFGACDEAEIVDPTGDFSYEISSENTLLVAFEAISNEGVTLEWKFGDGATSIALNPEHKYSTGGQYTVILTIFGEDGSSPVIITKDFTLIENPTADFNFDSKDLEVTFTSITKAALSLLWDFGDGNTSIEQNPTHTYADYGEYTVTLTTTGVEGSTPAVVTKTVGVSAAVYETIVIGNGDFELPGSGRLRDWADVPGWSCDKTSTDSGVEESGWYMPADNNDYAGVLYTMDGSTYNLTDYTIEADKTIKVILEGIQAWEAPALNVTIYYDNGDGTRNVIKTETFTVVSNAWTPIELVTAVSVESVGSKLGIEVANVPLNEGGEGWSAFDDVQVFVK